MNKLELAPQFVQDIDWHKLKGQKLDLLKTIKGLDIAAIAADSAGNPKTAELLLRQIDSIQGIINLIDGIQDYAVDVCGMDENEVFNN